MPTATTRDEEQRGKHLPSRVGKIQGVRHMRFETVESGSTGAPGLGYIAVAVTRARIVARSTGRCAERRVRQASRHRAAQAKGICVTGRFTPTPEAPRSPRHRNSPSQFRDRQVLLGRRQPQVADNAKATPRGLSVRFDHGAGANTDLVMISAPVFFAQTPALIRRVLEDRRVWGPRQASRRSARPIRRRRGRSAFLNSRPVPASYAGVNYWGVHAFTLPTLPERARWSNTRRSRKRARSGSRRRK